MTRPTIQAIPNQSTDEDVPLQVSVEVNDLETPVGQLILSGQSSNPVLLPPANITFEGTGATRTAILTPGLNAHGNVRVTLTVTDADGGTAETNFDLDVEPVDDAPVERRSV